MAHTARATAQREHRQTANASYGEGAARGQGGLMRSTFAMLAQIPLRRLVVLGVCRRGSDKWHGGARGNFSASLAFLSPFCPSVARRCPFFGFTTRAKDSVPGRPPTASTAPDRRPLLPSTPPTPQRSGAAGASRIGHRRGCRQPTRAVRPRPLLFLGEGADAVAERNEPFGLEH